MVKTRTKVKNANMQKAFDDTMTRFAQSMTHRTYTKTIDANERVTARTASDSTFSGVLDETSKDVRSYQSQGVFDVGDAILYVSSNDSESSSIVIESLIIVGTTAGSHEAWEVIAKIDEPDPAGNIIFRSFRLARRNAVTLT